MSCEMPVCYTQSEPTANTRHRCCECRGVIEPGTKYQRITGVWDGEGATYKLCLACDSLRDAHQARLRAEGLDEDWFPGLGYLFSDLIDSSAWDFLIAELPRLDAACAWATAADIRKSYEKHQSEYHN